MTHLGIAVPSAHPRDLSNSRAFCDFLALYLTAQNVGGVNHLRPENDFSPFRFHRQPHAENVHAAGVPRRADELQRERPTRDRHLRQQRKHHDVERAEVLLQHLRSQEWWRLSACDCLYSKTTISLTAAFILSRISLSFSSEMAFVRIRRTPLTVQALGFHSNFLGNRSSLLCARR